MDISRPNASARVKGLPEQLRRRTNGKSPFACLCFRLAIGKAWQPAEPPPIRRTEIGLVSAGQFLGDKCGEPARPLSVIANRS